MKYKNQANQHLLPKVQRVVMVGTIERSYHVCDNNCSQVKNKTKYYRKQQSVAHEGFELKAPHVGG